MNFFIDLLKKVIYRENYSSEKYVNFLKLKGIKIGEECTIFSPKDTIIDYQNPHMLELGNFVRIASGVKLLTHDYSLSVVAGVTGDVIGSVKKTTIGNNVFIGMNSIILSGVEIGNNVIIGAGSVVSHNCESKYVYAGVPAKKICTIEELYRKRKENELSSAKKCAVEYYKKTGKVPDEKIMREYLMLFSDRDEGIPNDLKGLMYDSGNYNMSKEFYFNNTSHFDSFKSFLKWCGIAK